LTDELFGSHKKGDVLLLPNAPSGKSRHIATHDYHPIGNSKSSEETMAPWQKHSQDANSSRLPSGTVMSHIASLLQKAVTHMIQVRGSK
jgi:hypothetical protein